MTPSTHPLTAAKFLELSADIAYRLSGRAFDPRTLLSLILEGAVSVPVAEDVLAQAISVVCTGYGDQRRKLGPMAVVHPIRVAAILSRVTRDPTMMDLLGAILHDRDEDLTQDLIGDERWAAMSTEMDALTASLDTSHSWYLGERIALLTCEDGGNYCAYLMDLMEHSASMPDLIRVKLADRLDNTLDVGVTQHGIPGSGVFSAIFNVMFLPGFQGFPVPVSYVPLSTIEGAQILANLFKNAEFLSLLRSGKAAMTGTTHRLYDALIRGSTVITQNLIQDTITTSLSVPEQREAVEEVLAYCQSGGLTEVREGGAHQLDGIFLDLYGAKSGRKDRLRQIFADKQYLARIGMVFLAVFSSFMSDPAYTIRGVDRNGLHPVGSSQPDPE